jgi:hypothetical protein
MPIFAMKIKGITIGDTQIEILQPLVWVKIDVLRIVFSFSINKV